jgi:hypothetical protein
LGHIISREGITVDDRKIEAIKNYGTPRNATELRRFLGMAGYYINFVEGYQIIAKPLTYLTGTRVKWEWEKDQREAFEKIKKELMDAPVLAYPNMEQPFTLTTD